MIVLGANVEFRLLGSVEAETGGAAVHLGSRQQRLVFALLAWEVNRLVTVDRLVAWVWADEPPRRAQHAVRVYVSQLRSALADDPEGAEIVTQGPGYVLRADPERIDAHRFQALVRQARQTDGPARIALLDEALALWRGPVMGDIAPTRVSVIAAIEETRLVATEERMEALLAAGRHAEIIDDLIELVDAHPTRERLVGQLALARYRGGQAGAALDVLRRTKLLLSRELGIDPGAELQRIEVAMLRQDAELDLNRPEPSEIVGRAGELARLVGQRRQAFADGPAVVLVEGEPGIGKTALLTEFARLCRRDNVPVWWGDAADDDGAPPYWPWRQALPDALARIEPDPTASADLGPEDRFVLFDRLTTEIGSVAGDGVVIVLDDLHASDTASLLLFAHLARQLSAPVLLIGAYRPHELPEGSLTRITNADRVTLAGLSTSDVQLLVSRHGGDPADTGVIAERTAGNPFFVKEVARLRPTEVPTVVREAVRQHLRAVSPLCREILTVASVLASKIDVPQLAAAASRPVDGVLDALDEAVATEIVRPDHRFAHDLVRESLLLEVAPSERRRIHLRAAEFGGDRSQIARHRLLALPLGDVAEAVAAARAAAEEALTQLAYEDAIRLFDQALSANHAPARGELLIGKATALALAFRLAEADEACRQAAETGDPVILARAAVLLPEQSFPDRLALVKPWCDQALAGLPAADSSLRAQVMAQRAIIAYADRETSTFSDESLAMAERLGDPTALVAALRARQHVRSGADGNAERLELADRMARLAGDKAELWGHLWAFDALMQAGRVAEAELRLERLDPVVDRLRQPLARWHLLRSRAAIHQGRGEFAAAYECYDEAARVADVGENPRARAVTEFVRAYLDIMAADEVRPETVAMMNAGVPSPVVARLALASFYVPFGRLEEARRLYQQVPPVAALPAPPAVHLIVQAQYGEVAAALGDVPTAEFVYDSMLPYADLHITPGAAVAMTKGSVHRLLGITAAAGGRTDAAADHFRRAIASNAQAGLPPFEAESQLRLAELTGDADLARSAAATADRLGMPLLRAEAARLLS